MKQIYLKRFVFEQLSLMVLWGLNLQEVELFFSDHKCTFEGCFVPNSLHQALEGKTGLLLH